MYKNEPRDLVGHNLQLYSHPPSIASAHRKDVGRMTTCAPIEIFEQQTEYDPGLNSKPSPNYLNFFLHNSVPEDLKLIFQWVRGLSGRIQSSFAKILNDYLSL